MAHYVMGDIHGEADRFHAMLDKIQFSEDDFISDGTNYGS